MVADAPVEPVVERCLSPPAGERVLKLGVARRARQRVFIDLDGGLDLSVAIGDLAEEQRRVCEAGINLQSLLERLSSFLG